MKLLHRIFTSMVGLSFIVSVIFIIIHYFTRVDAFLFVPVLFLFYIIVRSVGNVINDNIFKTTKIINIKEGEHRAEWGFKPVISFSNKTFAYKFQFSDNCIYNFAYSGGERNQELNHNLDVNKLFGVTHIDVHQDSARFGWNCDYAKKRINIYAYYYINGTRAFELIKTVDTRKDIEFALIKNEYQMNYYIDNEYCFSHPFPKNIFGYENFVYFGGDMVATHDMRIFKTKS